MVDAISLIFPQLGSVYQALFPWAEALLRVVVGHTRPARAAQHVKGVTLAVKKERLPRHCT